MNTRSSRGFTLTEILIAATIAMVILGALFAAFGPGSEKARASGLLRRAREYNMFLRTAVNERLLREPFPVTRAGNGGVVVTSGTIAAGSSAKQDQAANFEAIMFALRLVESIPAAPYSATRPAWAEAVRWNTTTKAFYFDAAYPTASADWTAAPVAVTWARIESRISAPATAPSSAAGANFRLAQNVNLPPQRVVVYWRIPNVPESYALALAKLSNKSDLLPALGAACDVGPVAYPAAVDGRTDVYVYIIHF